MKSSPVFSWSCTSERLSAATARRTSGLRRKSPSLPSISTRPGGRRGGYASAWGQASATPETALPPSRTLPRMSHLSFRAGKLEGEKLPSKGDHFWLFVHERLCREYHCSALESIVAEWVMVGHIECVTVGHIGHVIVEHVGHVVKQSSRHKSVVFLCNPKME